MGSSGSGRFGTYRIQQGDFLNGVSSGNTGNGGNGCRICRRTNLKIFVTLLMPTR